MRRLRRFQQGGVPYLFPHVLSRHPGCQTNNLPPASLQLDAFYNGVRLHTHLHCDRRQDPGAGQNQQHHN